MIATDPLSEYYRDLLDGFYDCVDRIVLNAYYPMGQRGGGFRTWWRRLHGHDENLDNNHLMRMAGRFSRRLHGWAKSKGIPLIHCKRGERKHLIAEKYLPADPNSWGIFLVLVSRAPAPVWEVQPANRHLEKKKPWPYVNHYSFHILDPNWGHLAIKMSGHPPFGAQILLNGHEYVASQARKSGIRFTKQGNCFTEVDDLAGLEKVADTLRCKDAVGRLIQVCEHWIYSCVCFGLDFTEQKKTNFKYEYSVYQLEYSRNLLFKRASKMEQVFDGIIERSRAPLDIHSVKTLFGFKQRPRRGRTAKARCEAVVEIPEYNLTVFKVHFRKQTLKIYTKGEHVLRIEAITHNTKDLGLGKVIARFPFIVSTLSRMVYRFLEVLKCVDIAWLSDGTLESLPQPARFGQTRIGGIDVNKARMRAMMKAVIALAPNPKGFSVSELAAQVNKRTGPDYRPYQASYDLRKLRAKHLVVKRPASRRYMATPHGLRTMVALVTLREKVIKPLLASAGAIQRGRPPKNRALIDVHYHNIQKEMRNLFKALNLAA